MHLMKLVRGLAQSKHLIHSSCDDDNGDGHKDSDEGEGIGGGQLGEAVKSFAQGLT